MGGKTRLLFPVYLVEKSGFSRYLVMDESITKTKDMVFDQTKALV